MQLLLNESEEFGLTKGLSVIEGTVKKFDFENDINNKIPHIGGIQLLSKISWKGTILESVKNLDRYILFIHILSN